MLSTTPQFKETKLTFSIISRSLYQSIIYSLYYYMQASLRHHSYAYLFHHVSGSFSTRFSSIRVLAWEHLVNYVQLGTNFV